MMPETLTLADLLVAAGLLWISGAVAGYAFARSRDPEPPEPLPDIHTIAARDASAFTPSTCPNCRELLEVPTVHNLNPTADHATR